MMNIHQQHPQPIILIVTIIAIVILQIHYINAKTCYTIDIRNDPRSLNKLRNCTVIVGNLKILLFDNVRHMGEYSDYRFPELKEITGYLLLYRVPLLNSLDQLFPNLRVIRGVNLLLDYSLIVFQMQNLTEIGLTNLLYIERGGVKVDKCPNLCYVDTVNWTIIGASKLDFRNFNSNYTSCSKCSKECVSGNCWNDIACQKMHVTGCHKECLGCTQYNSSRHCTTCKNFEDDGNCVKTCPPNKLINKYSAKCMSEVECRAMPNATWWSFKGECIKTCPPSYEQPAPGQPGCRSCGQNCVKTCKGIVVDNLAAIQNLYGCTHIDGALDIRVSDTYLLKDLEENVGRIVEIYDYLRVARSNAISSLEYFRSLKVIHGRVLENKQYALYVYENQNLQKLWNFSTNFTLTIHNGSYAFHNNPQLCFSEIEALANVTGIWNRTDMEIFKLSNGDKASCSSIVDLKISIISLNATNVTLTWQRLDVSSDVIIGFTIYYSEAPNDLRNISAFDSKDVCDDKGWNSNFVINNTVTLLNLKEYTTYAYYLKTYRMGTINRYSTGEQTSIKYFQTAIADPSELQNVVADAINDTTIELRWDLPKYPNGDLDYFLLSYIHVPDSLEFIRQRNYCRFPHTEEDADTDDEPILDFFRPNPRVENQTQNCCKREIQPFIEKVDNIFEKSMTNLCKIEKDSTCSKFIYRTDQDSNDESETFVVAKRSFGNISHPFSAYREIYIKGGHLTSYKISNLTHFGLYIFYLRVCNKNTSNTQYCSPVVMVSRRTKRNVTADAISKITIRIQDANASVYWTEPKAPNSLIVAYRIEYKRVDLEHSKLQTDCITFDRYQRFGHYALQNLGPGKYFLRVQTVSLAGPGLFSHKKSFDIQSQDWNAQWLYPFVIILVLVCITASLTIYWWYKKKHAIDNIHLIATVNPDYATTYMEDEWEVDRNDVEVLGELGQGTFGMVYEGLIKSKNQRCAIKTVTDTAGVMYRIEFLNEGSVMKSFCNSHHVVKLLGIVSRGQPPLVIMELMERGDLKSFLRRCRQPSQNLTSNEIYRMAIEIADGMAYLAAKKFVHRDLAARNCMVAYDRTVKIGDFGMARDIYETDYYRKETVGLLPVRWMAPESLTDGVFTSDSDVWSYGIVLWEMATLAEQPYQGLSNEEVLNFVRNKGRLDRPKECSDLMYEVMDACWRWRPIDRPVFADIVERLADHVGDDFRLVAFCYSREGREHALNAGRRIYNPPAMCPTVLGPDEEDDEDNSTMMHYDAFEDVVGLCDNKTINSRPKNNQRYESTDFRYD